MNEDCYRLYFTMPEHEYDLIVIGAGPAGLMWVNTAINAGKRVLLIDRGSFSEPCYSSINRPLTADSKINLGGIGGTANAWQGQCVQLDKQQFKGIFPSTSEADYDEYLRESKVVEDFLGIKIGHRSSKFEKRARRELQLGKDVNVKFSYIPMNLNWKSIFRKALSHRNLDYLETQVASLSIEDKRINALVLGNQTRIAVGDRTKVALATNAISTAMLLRSIESLSSDMSNEEILVYDHPWRTKYRYSARNNTFVRRKLFSYHIGSSYRMKSKYKFEVEFKDKSLGVFELRPVFEGNFLYKVIARGTQKIFGISIIPPTFVDVWCQVSQSKAFLYETFEKLEDALDSEDLLRLQHLEDTSKKLLTEAGFKLLSEVHQSSIEQAFHTTGTVALSSDKKQQLFNYPGTANKIENFYVSGAAILGNCSWVNPTFSILVIASLSAKRAFHTTSEI
jgi:hypothetical protein